MYMYIYIYTHTHIYIDESIEGTYSCGLLELHRNLRGALIIHTHTHIHIFK